MPDAGRRRLRLAGMRQRPCPAGRAAAGAAERAAAAAGDPVSAQLRRPQSAPALQLVWPGLRLRGAGVAGLGGYPGRRRAVLRSDGGVRVHHLRRLRMERPAGGQQPPSQRHLPQRGRHAHADQLHGAVDAPGSLGRARVPVPERSAALRRAGDPAQPKRQRRPDVRAGECRRQPAHRQRRVLPRRHGTVGGDEPAQGRLRVPAGRRRRHRRALRLREAQPPAAVQPGLRSEPGLPRPQLHPQRAQGRPAPGADSSASTRSSSA